MNAKQLLYPNAHITLTISEWQINHTQMEWITSLAITKLFATIIIA